MRDFRSFPPRKKTSKQRVLVRTGQIHASISPRYSTSWQKLLRWTPSFFSLFEGWHGKIFSAFPKKRTLRKAPPFLQNPFLWNGNSFGGQHIVLLWRKNSPPRHLMVLFHAGWDLFLFGALSDPFSPLWKNSIASQRRKKSLSARRCLPHSRVFTFGRQDQFSCYHQAARQSTSIRSCCFMSKKRAVESVAPRGGAYKTI